MMQSQAPTLVMGAAGGQQGGTGARVARELLAAGVVVRAFVRSNDERARALASLGAQVHVGDALDYDAVRASLSGIKRVNFLYRASRFAKGHGNHGDGRRHCARLLSRPDL